MAIRFLTLQEAIDIHDELIFLYGGKHGIRDEGLLDSAISQPKHAFAGNYIYQNFFEKAAAYFFHRIKNHPFIDGNKRTSSAIAILFLKYKGCKIFFEQNKLCNLAVKTATSKLSKKEIAQIFRTNNLEN